MKIIIIFSSNFSERIKVSITMSRLIKMSRLFSNKYNILSQTRYSSSSAVSKESLFFDAEVQGLMRKLTGLNYDKVFRRKRLGKNSERPIYQFMTQEVDYLTFNLGGESNDCLVAGIGGGTIRDPG